MKTSNKLALALGLGALLTVGASAMTNEDAYVENAQRGPGVPVPISVVAPDVQGFDVGKTVQVEFVVDATGRTSGFTVLSTNDPDLAENVIDAVKQWRFEPALQNGMPVAAKVILPVRIVEARPSSPFIAD